MPGFNSMSLSRSNTVHVPVVATSGQNTKTPYWAASEVQTASTAQVVPTPAVTNVQRKPVQAQAPTQAAPTKQAIARKPVAPTTTQTPAFNYKPVVGNPYTQGSAQQGGVQAQAGAQRPSTSHAASSRRRGSSPHWISGREVANLHQPGVAENCVKRMQAHNAAQPAEICLSPGQAFANGRSQPAPSANPVQSATRAISRCIGSVRRAAGAALNNEPKVSAPIPGSFSRATSSRTAEPTMLVPLDIAQSNVQQFGQADHVLEAARVAQERATAFEMLTGEAAPAPVATSSAKTSKATKPAAPPSPVPRQVVNDADRETLFGDIISAAQDASWVQKSQAQVHADMMAKSKARADGKGKAKASASRAPTAYQQIPSNFSSPSKVPEPLRVVKANANKTLPPTPAPSQKPSSSAPRPMRRASDTPSVKCSDCGKKLDAAAASTHRCPAATSTKVSRANTTKAAASSREMLYAANFGMTDTSSDDEPALVVDTFVQEAHTVWRGRVQSGAARQSYEGQIGGGLQGLRKAREAEAGEKAWMKSGKA